MFFALRNRTVYRARSTACLLVLLLSAIAARPAAAQAPLGPDDRLARSLRVFLDCPSKVCEFDRIRADVSFVDWVRDRRDADVHVLVTSEATAVGVEYGLDFIGRGGFAGETHKLSVGVPSWVSDENGLSAFTRRLRQGLFPYAVRADNGPLLDVVFDAEAPEAAVPARDPWNYWVFSFDATGSYYAQSQTRGIFGTGSWSMNRTTDRAKFDLTLYGSYTEDSFELADGAFVSTARDFGGSMLMVWSLGGHASFGIQPTVWSSTYDNLDLAIRVAPAFEVNLFPYSETSRRQFTLRYTVGSNAYRYISETLYDRTSERPWDHRVLLAADFVQPWGTIGASVMGSQYLHDPSKYRSEMDLEVDLRIARGLSFQVGGSYDVIRDQIFLPKRNATEEEVLLRRRQLATQFKSSLWAGFGFRFGSIYNSIVNNRLR